MNLTNFSDLNEIPPIQEALGEGLKLVVMSNYSNSLDAALEIIDNSVDERDSSNASLIINIVIKKNKITFFDSNSLGMGYKELTEFLNWGHSLKREEAGKIGKFGAGGKGAIGYLGKGCNIRTKRKGEDIEWELDVPNWRNEALKTLQPKALKSNVSINLGFTQIDIFDVDRNINKEELKRILGYIYKPLIKQKLIKISVNGSQVETTDFPLDENEKREEFIEDSKFGSFSGWYGKLAPKSGMRGGIRCFYNGRLITKDYKKIQEFFGHPDPQYMASMNYLIGEINLNFIPVLPNKTDYDRDSQEWILIEEFMYKKLLPIVQQLKSRKEEIEVNLEDVKNLKEVQELVVSALSKYEKRDFIGSEANEGNDKGRKPAERQGHHQKKNEPSNALDPRTPRTPPPSNAIGTLMRSKGFPKFDVRVGDGMNRAFLIEEGGMKMLIFDKLFPEFKARNGDTLYKAEAAIMQLVKPVSEEFNMSADQFIDVVDRLMSEVVNSYNTKHVKQQDVELEDVVS